MLKKTVFPFITILILFLLMEIIITVTGITLPEKAFKLSIFQGKPYIIEDYDTIWKFEENSEFTQKKIGMKINALGFRDREFSPTKTATRRIFCLGGSTTFGWGIRVEDTFSRRLESELLAYYGHDSFEVCNAGIVGFTSFQGLQLFKTKITAYEPDAVVFSFTYNDQQKRDVSIPAIYENLHSPSAQIRKIVFKSRTVRLISKFFNVFSIKQAKHGDQNKVLSVPLDVFSRVLTEMNHLCRNKNITLIFLSEFSSATNSPTDPFKEEMKSIAATHNIAYLDAQELIAEYHLHSGSEKALLNNSTPETVNP